jgi:hypothetical protein
MRFKPDEKKELVRHFSNRSRKAVIVGGRIAVPQVLSKRGEPLPTQKIGWRHVWDWTLREARFLSAFQKSGWDFEKTRSELDEEPEWAAKFVKRQSVLSYQIEEDQKKALAAVPTPDWIKAMHVRNVLGLEKIADEKMESMKELRSIVIPKQITPLQVNNFNFPALSPEQEKAAREFFDTVADEPPEERAA